MSNASKAPARAQNSAKQARIFCGYKSGSEAAKDTVKKQNEAVGAIRATCCFSVYGDTPTKADYEGVSDAVSRVSHMEGIAAKMSLSSDEQKQYVVDAILSAKVSQVQDFVDLVHFSVMKDPTCKDWKTGKGKTRKLTANVGTATKTKVKKAVELVLAKRSNKPNKGTGTAQPQDKKGTNKATPDATPVTNKAKWATALNALVDLKATADWKGGNKFPEKLETNFDTCIVFLRELEQLIK